MKKYCDRVPFGNETKLYIMATTCPGCGAGRGQFHKISCSLESCPQCGGRLLKCSCKALSIIDSFKLTRAIAKTLTRNEALTILDTNETIGSTYEIQGAFNWCCENAPPGFKEEMELRALEIIGGTKHGDMIRVPLHKAAECLGLSVEDAAPIMQELETQCLYPGWDERTGKEQ